MLSQAFAPEETPFRFLVALSFAGDGKRDKVREVATILRERLGEERVFFDEFFVSEIAGHDADTYLQDIYLNETLLVVPCVCERYDEKPWTQDEWRAIRAFEREKCRSRSSRLRFFPLRFGDGEVDGLYSNAIVPDVRNDAPEDIAQLICDRLKRINDKITARSFVRRSLGNWVGNFPSLSRRTWVIAASTASLMIVCAVVAWFLYKPPPVDEDPTALPDPLAIFTDAPTASLVQSVTVSPADDEFKIEYRNLTDSDLTLLILDFKAHFEGRFGWREIPVAANTQQFEAYGRLFNGPGWYGVAVRLPNKKVIGLGCKNFPPRDPGKCQLTLVQHGQDFSIDEWSH